MSSWGFLLHECSIQSNPSGGEKKYSYMEVATTQSGPENAWVQLAQMGTET